MEKKNQQNEKLVLCEDQCNLQISGQINQKEREEINQQYSL